MLPDPPGALGLHTPSLANVYELNLVLAPPAADPARAAAACRRLGLWKVRFDGPRDNVAFPPGWTVERDFFMVLRRPADRPPGAVAVRALGWEELEPFEDEMLRTHGRPPEVRRELVAQLARWEAAAPGARRLGIAEGGRVVAWCRVYDDGTLTEIDGVGVLPAERGRGLGRALLEGVLAQIPAERTVFLVADAEDWPRRLYERLGFDAIATQVAATRPR